MRKVIPVLFAAILPALLALRSPALAGDEEEKQKAGEKFDLTKHRHGSGGVGDAVDPRGGTKKKADLKFTPIEKKKPSEPIKPLVKREKEDGDKGGFWKDAMWVGGGAAVFGFLGFLLGGPMGAVFGAVIGGAAGYFLKGLF